MILRSLRLLLLTVSGALVLGCGAAQRAAARDPVRCERDPDCVTKQGKSRDCSTACSDNIDCMERCQQIQRGVNP